MPDAHIVLDASHIVPDTVFYVCTLGTLLVRSLEQGNTIYQHQLTIGPRLDKSEDINVPILVVEYVKTNLLVGDG